MTKRNLIMYVLAMPNLYQMKSKALTYLITCHLVQWSLLTHWIETTHLSRAGIAFHARRLLMMRRNVRLRRSYASRSTAKLVIATSSPRSKSSSRRRSWTLTDLVAQLAAMVTNDESKIRLSVTQCGQLFQRRQVEPWMRVLAFGTVGAKPIHVGYAKHTAAVAVFAMWS